MYKTLLERIEDKFTVGDGCWLWTAGKDRRGYGKLCHEGKMLQGHRVVYELIKGPIPEGLELDHLCRVPNCVRPDHLEPVTHHENILRGRSPVVEQLTRTHCPAGHAYEGTNLLVHRGKRSCRECKKVAMKKWWHSDAGRKWQREYVRT